MVISSRHAEQDQTLGRSPATETRSRYEMTTSLAADEPGETPAHPPCTV